MNEFKWEYFSSYLHLGNKLSFVCVCVCLGVRSERND